MSKSKSKNDGWNFFPPEIPRINWNPITGCPNLHTVIKTKRIPELKHPAEYKSVVGCSTPDGKSYCYMAEMCNRFPEAHKPEFRFHESRMGQIAKLKKPHIVVVGSAGDMWAYSQEHIEETEKVLQVCIENPQHFYVFLTRQPLQYSQFILPENCLCGVTVTQLSEIWRIDNLKWETPGFPKFVMIEPCFFPSEIVEDLPDCVFEGIDLVIIGALTGGKKEVQKGWKPSKLTVLNLTIKAQESGAKVYYKNSITDMPSVKQYPDCILKWREDRLRAKKILKCATRAEKILLAENKPEMRWGKWDHIMKQTMKIGYY